jgi:hypothetical protein
LLLILQQHNLGHTISPGKKPEGRPATAEEFCGAGESLKTVTPTVNNVLERNGLMSVTLYDNRFSTKLSL